MAIRPKRKGTERKTETMNMRVDPKFAFAVWFASEIKGQSQATFVERAVYAAIDEAKDKEGKSWKDYWDPSEGIRTLNLLRAGIFRTDADEDRLLDFVRAHAPFFIGPRGEYLRREIDILWPGMDHFVERWLDTKLHDYWGIGKQMAGLLSGSGLTPPEWPPKERADGEPVAPQNDAAEF
jgi:hypothetical protein